MNKNFKNASKALMLGAAAVALNGVAIEDAKAATGTGAMSAVILAPINITEDRVLHFGSMTVATAAGGTVTLPTVGPAANRAEDGSGNVTLVSGAIVPDSGQMDIVSAGGVDLQASVVGGAATVGTSTIQVVNGGDNMTVFNFDVDLFGAEDTAVGNVLAITAPGTNVDVVVGAELAVGAGQAVGTYTGNYTLNVIYN